MAGRGQRGLYPTLESFGSRVIDVLSAKKSVGDAARVIK